MEEDGRRGRRFKIMGTAKVGEASITHDWYLVVFPNAPEQPDRNDVSADVILRMLPHLWKREAAKLASRQIEDDFDRRRR